MHHAAGVLNDLDGLNARQIIEKPAATGVHHHRVTLQFEQLPKQHLIRFGNGPVERILRNELSPRLWRAVHYDIDVAVSSLPRILNQFTGDGLIGDGRFIAQPIERGAQWSTPFLIPSQVSAARTAAIAFPAAHAMGAAPGRALDDFYFKLGRMIFQELAIVGDLRQLLAVDVVERIGQRHVAVAMMVAVRLSIGGDVDQLRTLTIDRKAAGETVGETLTIIQQTFKGNRLRQRSVVEEEC